MSDLYHVSSSPHVRAKDSTDRIMLYVIIALLPASLFGIYNFGFRALFIILLTIASCVASEWVFDYIVKKKSTITDLSAVVTGLLLALTFRLHFHGGRLYSVEYLQSSLSSVCSEDSDRTL